MITSRKIKIAKTNKVKNQSKNKFLNSQIIVCNYIMVIINGNSVRISEFAQTEQQKSKKIFFR